MKCKHEVDSIDKREGSVITTTYTCSSCGHVEVDTLELRKTEDKKPDEHYEEDRRRFCFSEEKGKEYSREKDNMIQFYNLAKEIEERDKNRDQYEAVAKIKKLPFGEVQKTLMPIFEILGYTNLQFQPPEMDKDVIVNFTGVDSKEGRSEYDSKQDLKKGIQEALKGSNWRLMSDGINYRMGFVSGRLKGVEREEDLLALVQNRKVKKDGN